MENSVSQKMVKLTVEWFHQVMVHPGLNKTLRQQYYHPKLGYHIDCLHCQRHKLTGRGYGLLPERELRIAP